jgi:dimethylglycine dehydrogenase
MARVPLLGTAGLSKVINGPIPYTPDGNPLIGPMPGVPNAFEACVFTFGICQGAAPARCWPNGSPKARPNGTCGPAIPPLHRVLRPALLLRRQGHGGLRPRIRHALPPPRLARRPAEEALGRPRPDNGAGRAIRRLQRLGARQLVRQARRRHVGRATQTWDARRPLAPASARNAWPFATMRASSTSPASPASGSTARARAPWLDRMVTGACPSPAGSASAISPTTRPDRHRDVDPRHGRRQLRLITAAAAQWHDRDWLAHLRTGPDPHRRDRGPDLPPAHRPLESRAILAPLTTADLARPWLSHQPAEVAGNPATSCASPSRANSAGRSTAHPTPRRPSGMR